MTNNFFFAGYLASDSVLKYTVKGDPYLFFDVIQSKMYLEENIKTYVPFVQFFKKESVAVEKHMKFKKGALVMVEAEITNRKDDRGFNILGCRATMSYLMSPPKNQQEPDDYL